MEDFEIVMPAATSAGARGRLSRISYARNLNTSHGNASASRRHIQLVAETAFNELANFSR